MEVTNIDERGMFSGNDEQLCNCIKALIELNDKRATTPPVPQMAVSLLIAASDRIQDARAQSGNWQETLNELTAAQSEIEALRAKVERLRKSFCEVQHSIEQARIPGNDWRRELILIENITRAALTERKP